MSDQQKINIAEQRVQQIIDQVINFWLAQNKAIDTFLNQHPDEVYLQEVAPGRNRAVYVLAHLIATNDGLLPLFGFGEKLFPEIAPLATEGESAVDFELSFKDLKKQWESLNLFLEKRFRELTPEEWLGKHNSVSDADFLLDPQRNKLNVLINRASHQNYHRGQLIFLNERKVLAKLS
ncbi:DinB family protein [Mucilaginibacter polytrichastri]|uniref:Uncharacterized protein n=1 Tax=Mucilaginibacter polytrichastri TaxID=1302689 RepID=A0A1Q6A277_9SPHI|nr:DinB family protein [Mucilaginibacter polytrichastri]OKS88113.1 hypothetical protein RG47T_3577 [Mucilaginibacter polytrichastri]SFT09605.1 DinB superfamily protein [Mucilaginibacter polytrichastri]